MKEANDAHIVVAARPNGRSEGTASGDSVQSRQFGKRLVNICWFSVRRLLVSGLAKAGLTKTFQIFILERAQKIDDFLLLLNGQLIEVFDDLIGLAAVAPVSPDSINQVGRTPIMEEEDALSDAPQRRSSELVGTGATLRNAVGQGFAHVVHQQVGEKIRSLIGKRRTRTGRGTARNHCSGGKRRCMAVHTSNLRKQVAPLFAGRRGWSGRWRTQHPHEVGKRFDV